MLRREANCACVRLVYNYIHTLLSGTAGGYIILTLVSSAFIHVRSKESGQYSVEGYLPTSFLNNLVRGR